MFKNSNNILIQTDFRIELSSAVIYLSNFNNEYFIDKSENDYSKMINHKFKTFKEHQVVLMFPDMWEMGLRWDGIPQLALHLNSNIELSEKIQLSEELQSRFNNNISDLMKFLSLLKDFSKKSNFENFYNEDLDNVTKFVSYLNNELKKYPLIFILENYLNIKLYKQSIILSKLLKSSFGATIIDSENNREIFCIMSSYWLNVANNNGRLNLNLLSTIWHELLHSIINPLTNKLFGENPFNLSESQLDWYCELNESIIWAITLRLLIQEKILSKRDYNWYFDNAIQNGAPKTKEMNELLMKYENDKVNYSNFREFYPILQNEFGQPPKMENEI